MDTERRELDGSDADANGTVVDNAAKPSSFPLSFSQRRLWVLSQLGASRAYHTVGSVQLAGALDASVLERAINCIVARHDSLRTRIVLRDGEPVQEVDPRLAIELGRADVSAESRPDAVLRKLVSDYITEEFDLTTGPLVRAVLVQLARDSYELVITMHHIIADGWSLGVLVHELGIVYKAFAAGRPSPLRPLTSQYGEFSARQRRSVEDGALKEGIAYWASTLRGAPARLALPFDFPPPAQQEYDGGGFRLVVPTAITSDLSALAKQHRVTLYMVVLSGWALMLHRISGEDDLVVGTPVAGRDRREEEPLIGMFAESLALRIGLQGNPTVAELLHRVREVVLQAQTHRKVPLEKVIEVVEPPRTLAHSPIFQVQFVWNNTPKTSASLPGIRVSPGSHMEAATSQFDLSLALEDLGGELIGSLTYANALFRPSSAKRFASYLLTILKAMTESVDQTLSNVPLLDHAEQRQLRHGWNDTDVEWDDAPVHELVARAAERHPDGIAVQFEDTALSYGELERQSQRLSNYLRKVGVGPDCAVGVCLERSLDLVISLLAILKSGGRFVPLEPDLPIKRLNLMLEDARPSVIVTHKCWKECLGSTDAAIVCLDEVGAQNSEAPVASAPSPVSEDSAAYTIFTSGSTGRPKGATNTHCGLLNCIMWMQHRYRLEPSDRLFQKTPIGFDVSVWEFFWPLTTGATIVLARPGQHANVQYLAEEIAKQGITTVHFVPSALQALIDGGASLAPSLRRIICIGETLQTDLALRVRARAPGTELHNVYGPTEASIEVTHFQFEGVTSACASVPIGRPISNTQIYILDKYLQLVPERATGELYIGGDALARGYENRPALTAERFVPNPFDERGGTRLYRTGDIVRRLHEGDIEFLGRVDDQVKINGVRIELREIELALLEHPLIRQAVVTPNVAADGQAGLAAYLVVDEETSSLVLRRFLKDKLPPSMIPSSFVFMKGELPRTASGKLDARRLPEAGARPLPDREPLETRSEKLIGEVWKRLLKIEEVGRDDNFFDLGGHSLQMMSMIHALKTQHDIQLTPRAVLLDTLRQLASNVPSGD